MLNALRARPLDHELARMQELVPLGLGDVHALRDALVAGEVDLRLRGRDIFVEEALTELDDRLEQFDDRAERAEQQGAAPSHVAPLVNDLDVLPVRLRRLVVPRVVAAPVRVVSVVSPSGRLELWGKVGGKGGSGGWVRCG